MNSTTGAILFAIALFAVSFIYYTIKEKAKRNIFFKEQYERQKSLTHQARVFTTTASVKQIKEELNKRIPTDSSLKASLKGGNYSIKENTDRKITYHHNSKITTGSGGDEFTGSLYFEPQENELRVVLQIEQWREKDGVTRRAGIEAMEYFVNMVTAAIKEADNTEKTATNA